MPVYDFHCTRCHRTDEVFLWANEPAPDRCQHCGGKTLEKLFPTSVLVIGDRGDWSNHNGGRGEYCPQLARRPKDPNAWYRSAKDVAAEGRRRGYTVHKDGLV